MDKIIIYNGLESYGFLLTNFFLNEGYEVIGVKSLERNSDEAEANRLEVGRNANFTEMPLADVTDSIRSGRNENLVIVNFIEVESDAGNLLKLLGGNRKEQSIILLFSIRELSRCEEMLTPFQQFRNESKRLIAFFLPTIVEDDQSQAILTALLELSSVKLLT